MGQVREKVVGAARELFAARGYGSTGVADIRRAAGVHSGSLYYAFPTKQAVLEAVLEDYLQRLDPYVIGPAWQGVDDPIDRIFALLGRYRGFLQETQCFFGCPIGSLALELHAPEPGVRELLVANFDQWVLRVRRCLDDAGDRLPADLDRDQLARFVLVTMEGAVMLARTYRGLDHFDAAIAMLRAFFDRLDAAQAGGPSRAIRKLS